MPVRLHAVDLGVVALYLVAITLFGLRFARKGAAKDRSLRGYFLADKTVPWWAIALSIVSAETSTLTIIGTPGLAFAGDFGFLQIVLGYMCGRIVVALLFLPKYFHGEMLTAYQLIDRRFGKALYKVTAGLFLLTRAAAEGVRVFAVSIVVGIAIGTGDVLSIAIISGLTLLYTFEGGMAAVIWTDVVQMAIYVGGTIVALWSLGQHVPGGWAHIHAVAAPAGKFHMLNFALNLTTTYTFWAGLLGGTFLTMASHGTDQLMVQRMLAARNLRESRLALLSSGIVIFAQFAMFLLIGVGLWVFYGDHPAALTEIGGANGNRIFPGFIVHQMPTGIAGLLIAAILAAAMSNLSAALNSLSSTTVVDFYMGFRPNAADAERMLVSRASTVLWALVLFAVAVYAVHAGGKGNVVEIGLSIASVAYGCLLGVFLLGTLTRYATQTGAIIGMITGFAMNLWLWHGTFPLQIGYHYYPLCRTSLACPQEFIGLTIPHVAYTWYVLIGAIATFAVGSLASLIFRKQSTCTKSAVAAVPILLVILSGAPRPCNAQSQIGRDFSPGNQVSDVAGALAPETCSATTLCRKTTLLAASSPAPQLPSKPAPPPPSTYDFSAASAAINKAIAEKKLPGAVLLVGHNGQIVFHQAYGVRKYANEPGLDGKPSPAEPMTEDTIFDMASLTKCLATATAIMQLVEQGKVDVDAPVITYLPEFAGSPANSTAAANANPSLTPNSNSKLATNSNSPTTLSANGATIYQPGAQPQVQAQNGGKRAEGPTYSPTDKSKVTVRELLTHYSGLPEDVSLKDPWGLTAPDKAEGIRRAMNSELKSVPGTKFVYSDVNFITLGAIVEKVSGESLDVYAERHIFGPLAMRRTGFKDLPTQCKDFDGGATLPQCPFDAWWMNTAPTQHDNEGTADTNPDFDHLLRGTVHDPTTRRMGGVAGHAGVFSIAGDVAKFAQALLEKLLYDKGPFPLKQSTLKLMTTPEQPSTAQPGATIFTPDGKPTTGIAARGFGWDINTAFSRPRGEIFPIGSFGHTGFTGTSLWMDPASDTYIVLLANSVHPRGASPISPLRGEVATDVAKALGLAEIAYQPKDCEGKPDGQPVTVEEAAVIDLYCKTSGATDCPGVMVCATGGQPLEIIEPQATAAPFIPKGPGPWLSGPGIPVKGDCNAPGVVCDITVMREPFHPLTEDVHLKSMIESAETMQVKTGIDVLESTHFAALKDLAAKHGGHLRIGLLTNQTGLDSQGGRTIDILRNAGNGIELVALFSPEHGIFGAKDAEVIGQEVDSASGLKVTSLYGPKDSDKRLKPEDLKSLDAVVIDLQDAGVRFYTYETVLGYFVEASSCEQVLHQHPLEIVVLDRPALIGGEAVQGPISDTEPSYINYSPEPVRNGMTLGELATFFSPWRRSFSCGEGASTPVVSPSIPAATTTQPDGAAPLTRRQKDLERIRSQSGLASKTPIGAHGLVTVVQMQNWHRDEFYDQTGLPWINPSPNLRNIQAATVYPGLGMLDYANISVGRGATTPFEVIGAGVTPATKTAPAVPAWFDGHAMAAYLTARHIPGVTFAPTTFAVAETSEKYPYHGQTIEGVKLTVTDRQALDSPELGIEILSALHHLYPTQFKLDQATNLVANSETMDAIRRGDDPRTIAASWAPALAEFKARRSKYLLYP